MDTPTIWKSDIEFEHDVIRIARALWPNAGVGGAVILQDRERDGVFIGEDVIHIIECTTSRMKQKAVDDIEKSIKLARALQKQHREKSIQCWFITAGEPTPAQRTVGMSRGEFRVNVQSYSAFRNKLIDANAYLNLRREYAFGSARNLKDGSAKLDRAAYVDLDFLRINDSSVWSVDKISDEILAAKIRHVVLLGDFGAGKSMSLRELFLTMSEAFHKGQAAKFPVYINLRDHSGQPDPVEVLERHARRIGFSSPAHLVRAWRAGYVVLILDGFDELSSTGWLAFNKRLRQVRFATVEVIRQFVIESPSDAPVLVAGRVSYFDNEDECLNAFGMRRETTSIFSLNDFSEQQIGKYLKKFGLSGDLPQWLPARPLLIGYLAVRGALSRIADGGSQDAPGPGWDNLLALVCDREARTHIAVDADTVRQLVESLASVARSKGGLGAPLATTDMIETYRNVVGFEPDERAETLLMRLPGLGSAAGAEGARAFVDADFGGAAAAGDVARFIENPFGITNSPVLRVKEVLQETGIAVLGNQISRKNIPTEKIYVAMKAAVQRGDSAVPEHGLAVDLFKLLATGDYGPPKEEPKIAIKEVLIDELDLSNYRTGLSGIDFNDCIVGTLHLSPMRDQDPNLPRFNRGIVEHVEGRATELDISKNTFREVQFGTFSEIPATNAAVLDAQDLESGVKALVTVLRKLFFQKGAGRKENAFYRGIPGITNATVDEVLKLLESADYAQRTKRSGAEAIWYPNRRMTGRAKLIVASPRGSRESIVVAARAIGRPKS